MARYIDADAFKEVVGTDTKLRRTICAVIDKQPTTYDVSFVLEQVRKIGDRIFNYCEEIDLNLPEEERTGYNMLKDIELLYEVVKKGGVEAERLVWNERE